MELAKEIELELNKTVDNEVEEVEDVLIKDSVLQLLNRDFTDDVDELEPTALTRKAVLDLGPEYSGKPVSRKKFFELERDVREQDEEESDEDNEENDVVGSGSEGDFDSEQLEDDSSAGEEVEDEEIDDGEEDEDDESGDDKEGARFAKKSGEKSIEFFSAATKDIQSEISRGKSVRNQLSIWESLLECRIKIQPCLVAVNKLFQTADMTKFRASLESIDEGVVAKSTSSVSDLLGKMLDLQELLLRKISDEMAASCSSPSKESPGDANGDDESISSSVEDENYDDVPEHESGTESTEAESQQRKRKSQKIEEPTQPSKKPKQSNLLDELYNGFAERRDASLSKWAEKTRLFSGKLASKDFSAFEGSILKTIEAILYDRDRLVRKTQLKRSDYVVLGRKQKESEKENNNSTMNEVTDEVIESVNIQDRVQNEYDTEIFDDDDYYHKLLKDFIDRKLTDTTDPSKHGRQWLELQNMRSKMKRKVDTKASKGRKLRYTVHPKLVNYMAPIPCLTLNPEADAQLFKSLFGAIAVK